MPAIFNDEKRKQMRINILENGFEHIKRFGLKRTSIEEVAKDSGIAKVTFYNFFPSKEEFVASIILYKREAYKREITALVGESGGLTKECIRKILNAGRLEMITFTPTLQRKTLRCSPRVLPRTLYRWKKM